MNSNNLQTILEAFANERALTVVRVSSSLFTFRTLKQIERYAPGMYKLYGTDQQLQERVILVNAS